MFSSYTEFYQVIKAGGNISNVTYKNEVSYDTVGYNLLSLTEETALNRFLCCKIGVVKLVSFRSQHFLELIMIYGLSDTLFIFFK